MKEEIERTPLRTILTNFLNHIDSLENQRTHDNTYESEFQELKLFSESIKGTKQFSSSEGEKEVNRKKNRYKDILPFDVSRVVLNEYAGVPGSDYINANYIKGASGSPAYIASQGPLPYTVNDFWRMVVQCEVQVIIMACNKEEAGKHKCENYWVEGEGEEKQFGMVKLRLLKASTVCPDFSVRTMRLKYTNNQSNSEERTVCQFHYSTWPDHGVPPLVRPLLDMVRLVRDTQASETLPVLIHCSAGCGRTGTICAIDYVWGLLRAGKLTKDFSLLTLVKEMRKQRIAMVQTKEQYVLVHQAVRELFKEQLRMIDSHPYENIDCNGLPLIKCPSPDPTYDSLTNFQNNKAEEKQDEKEKEIAPPLPQKKRFQILSSKQAKEVENLSERQRLVEQGGSSSDSVASASSSGPRPCIATLRSLFEQQLATRDSRQVSRSHSLGSVRPPTNAQTQPSPLEMKKPSAQKPIDRGGILRLPQRPALPVKRSKSLRILGSGDRSKLSIPPPPPCEVDMHRRLSLESNYEDLVQNDLSQQPLSDYLSVDSIVAGLGVRERRNSFRKAVHRETHEAKPSLLRSYTSVDMRSAREIKEFLPIKPILKPKPNTQPKSDGKTIEVKKNMPDPRSQFLNQQKVSSKQVSDLYEFNRTQAKSSSSCTLTKHSMSVRLAPKPKREDCRVILTTKPGILHSVYVSGESSMSSFSDKSSLNSKSSSSSHNTPIQLQLPNSKPEPSDVKDKQVDQSTHHQHIPSSDQVFHQNYIGSFNEASHLSANNSKSSPGKPEQIDAQQYYRRVKSLQPGLRKQPPPQSIRPVVYDSKNARQNSEIYGSAPKETPPPYVEPGKNAEKPRSSPYFAKERQANSKEFHNDIYSKTQEQKQWQIVGSSRDMILPSHSSITKANLRGINIPETSAVKYTRNVERRHIEPDYRLAPHDLVSKKISEKRPDGQDYRLLVSESETYPMSDRKYIDHINPERSVFESTVHRTSQETSSNPVDRQYVEQTPRSTARETYFKSYSDRKSSDQNMQISTQNQILKSRPSQDFKSTNEDIFYRNSGDKRSTNKELSHSNPQETTSKFVESRHLREEFNSSSSTMVDDAVGPPKQYQSPLDRRANYQSSSEELYPKITVSSRTPADKNFLQSHQEPRILYNTPRMAHTHPQGNWNTPKLSDYSRNKSETSPIQGVKMRMGSQDDLALCATTPSRVKRHASVVMLRHSLIEGGNNDPLSVWKQATSGADPTANQNSNAEQEDLWTGAVGVDLDQVAASMNTQKDGKMMKAALEALHLRKASQATQKSAQKAPKMNHPTLRPNQSVVKSNQPLPKSSHLTSKLTPSSSKYTGDSVKTPGSPPQFKSPPEVTKPGPFRKQQQYL